eukprot:6187777-Pleurochrysis_carterae.AAC.2
MACHNVHPHRHAHRNAANASILRVRTQVHGSSCLHSAAVAAWPFEAASIHAPSCARAASEAMAPSDGSHAHDDCVNIDLIRPCFKAPQPRAIVVEQPWPATARRSWAWATTAARA